jgi:uncharacterized protein (TIGR03382 family)
MPAAQVGPGDVVISELMPNPTGTESLGEWFEIYNTTSADIDVTGFVFHDETDDRFVVGGATPVTLPARGYLVLGRSANAAENGGVPVDYVYSRFNLANRSDEIILEVEGVEIDRVEYDVGAGYTIVEGRSLTLSPDRLDAMANDTPDAWCRGETPLAGGDFGTPGDANDACAPPVDVAPPAIVHTPVANGVPAGAPVRVTVIATDASGVPWVDLFHRRVGVAQYTEQAMTPVGADTFEATIPGADVTTGGVEYYVRAIDGAPAGNVAMAPATAPAVPYTFTPSDQGDVVGPTITHDPITADQLEGADVDVRAIIADAGGVLSATLYYRAPQGQWFTVDMIRGEGDEHRATIPGARVARPAVEYYFDALDNRANLSALPEDAPDAFFSVPVVTAEEDRMGPAIVHTPIAVPQPAGEDVTVTATVTDASGVDSVVVFFRPVGGTRFESAELHEAPGDTWAGEIPAARVIGPAMEYYLEATDSSPQANTSTNPASAPESVWGFNVEGGGLGPVIDHTPVTTAEAGKAIDIVATVTDDDGVAEVTLHYRATGTPPFIDVVMTKDDAADTWRARITGAAVGALGLEYYVEATDAGADSDTSTHPPGAPLQLHAIDVTGDVVPPTTTGCDCHAATGPDATAALSLLLLSALALRPRRRGLRRG